MSPASVLAVERLCIRSVEEPHSLRELLLGRLEDEVVVIRHQAEDLDVPVVAPNGEREEPQEEAAVVVVEEDRDPSGAASGAVEEAVGLFAATLPRHPVTVSRADGANDAVGKL